MYVNGVLMYVCLYVCKCGVCVHVSEYEVLCVHVYVCVSGMCVHVCECGVCVCACVCMSVNWECRKGLDQFSYSKWGIFPLHPPSPLSTSRSFTNYI